MNEKAALDLLRTEFQRITGLAIEDWHADPARERYDATLRAGGHLFVVEYKAAANAEQISSALRRSSDLPRRQTVPLLVVPYMGTSGRELCRVAGMSWLDLSGNAEIDVPSLRIRILGEPNKFKRPGQPQSLFAPRGTRAARTFLIDADRSWLQTELAEATGLTAGYLSRLLPRYEEAGFITHKSEGKGLRYHVTDPTALLDAWYADYDFNLHTIIRGHVAAREGVALLRELSAGLTSSDVKHAATGLAGAWLWEPFAAFRTVTLYLSARPSELLLSALGFHEGTRGSNTWLVVPDDAGVFAGQTDREDIPCVSAAQVYVDLKAHSERAEEARAELRRTHLSWPGAKQKGEP
jgi:hypothetical protein